MVSSDRDNWLLLSNRLPGALAPRLLGRFVTTPERPTDGYAPENPAEFLTAPIVEVEDQSATATIEKARDASAKAELNRLFTFHAGANSSTSDTFQADRVKTYSLQQHYDCFDELIAAQSVSAKIDKLFERAKGKCYMIVGVRVCGAGSSIGHNTNQGRNLGLSVTVPLSEALGGVTDIANPEVGGEVSSSNSQQSSSKTVGDQVFALELLLCTQTSRWLGRYDKRASKELQMVFAKRKKSEKTPEELAQWKIEKKRILDEEENRVQEQTRELREALQEDVGDGQASVFM